MTRLRDSEPDDQQLVRYLLGLLPEGDAERLDELSIADDDVAWRLRTAESDLVDAYVGGTLTGDTLARFESFYLSSQRRRQTVRFAGSFFSRVARGTGRTDGLARYASIRARDAQDAPSSRASLSVSAIREHATRSAGRFVLSSGATCGLAAAAALLILAGGALLFQEMRLLDRLNEEQRQASALDHRTHELEQRLEDQRAANAETARELERVRASLPPLAQQSATPRSPDRRGGASQALATIALVLLPQTRAVDPIPALAVPPGTDRVAFELRLESNRFSRYQVALKDPATNQIVWRSGRLTVTASDDQPAVSAIVPAGVLKPQHYSLELIGDSADGRAQIAGSYAVRIIGR